ncbi:MAG: DUF302 domain-containing protein [Firmicutes bacterium]|nr:DUF302 domain-containing protein [Bacillota bacterium]MCL5013045.1 DUF302 domain-containing protein [Bacillota bacterium]
MASSYQIYKTQADPDQVMIQLRRALGRRNLIEYAVIDHRHDMAERQVENPPWAYSLIFGSPVAGAKFMEKALTSVADMPVRLGIYGGSEGSKIIYHTMSSLLEAHHPDLGGAGQKIDQLVQELCNESEAKLSEEMVSNAHQP